MMALMVSYLGVGCLDTPTNIRKVSKCVLGKNSLNSLLVKTKNSLKS
jgi:hypothetical protein